MCYWNSWSYYRRGNGKSQVQKLDTSPCTHMIYNIIGIRGAEVVLSDPWNDLSDNGGNGKDVFHLSLPSSFFSRGGRTAA